MFLDTDSLTNDLILRQIGELNELLGEGRGIGGEWVGEQITGNECLDPVSHPIRPGSSSHCFLTDVSYLVEQLCSTRPSLVQWAATMSKLIH